jgi:hypothetical protein
MFFLCIHRAQINATQKSIAQQMKSLQEILADHDKWAFLRSAHAYPMATFPWGHENILALLMRKRLDPAVVAWASRARARGGRLESGGADGMSLDNWEDVWDWAAPVANEIARDVLMGAESEGEDGDEEEDGGGMVNGAGGAAGKDGGGFSVRPFQARDALKFGATGMAPPVRPVQGGGAGMRRP